MSRQPKPPLPPDEADIFREAVSDAQPLPDPGKIHPPAPRAKPYPKQSRHSEHESLVDSLSDHVPWEQAETGDELCFVRPGLTRQTLRKLKRGHWAIQEELDLHGMVSDEARMNLVTFLAECRMRDARCVRVIHGKGLSSKNREPVLKFKVRNWLMQRDDVLAFCQARPMDGGSGAVIVLLKSAN
jgi:DNA-nicking Smr family endonuclease